MKTIKLSFLLSFFAAILLFSCTEDIIEENLSATQSKVIKFNVCFGNYDNTLTSRASKTIPDRAQLYIYKNGEENNRLGIAEYDSKSAKWTLNFQKALPDGSMSCAVYYFENPKKMTTTDITFGDNTVLYFTSNGTLTNSTSTLELSAVLKPNLSRVRFKGTSGAYITVSGMKYPKTFSLATKSFTYSTDVIKLTVSTNGYTPYVYYSEPSSANLSVTNIGVAYSIANPLTSGGNSGYIDIPSSATNGWTRKATDLENGYEYVDLGLSVKWATMNVGANNPEEPGGYYAWGETAAYGEYPSPYADSWTGERNPNYSPYAIKNGYTNTTYKWGYGSGVGSDFRVFKYCSNDNLTALLPEDDAAHVNWGGKWRMPTYEEAYELVHNCYWTQMKDGYVITGQNGSSIYMPKTGSIQAGDRNGSSNYWTSIVEPNPNEYSYRDCKASYTFRFNNIELSSRFCGYTIRAVCP